MPQTAMVLAAGLGTRMRPLTQTTPKPLVAIHGQTLLDRTLDKLYKADISRIVVNVHYLANQIIDHLQKTQQTPITISDETDELLDSAGGIIKALPMLGNAPFYVLNSDTFWHDANGSTIAKLAQNFDIETMDMLILTVRRDQAASKERGDFIVAPDGRLKRAAINTPEAVIYGGVLLINPTIFTHAKPTPHSLNVYFDLAIEKGRLYGLPLEGEWYTVGTMDMIDVVEKLLVKRGEENAS